MFENEPQKTAGGRYVSPHPWYLRSWMIVIWLFLALVLSLGLAFGLTVRDRVRAIKARPATPLDQLERATSTEGRALYALGTTSPKVTLVEFADYACPYSKAEYPVIRDFVLAHRDQVRLIYRDLPVIAQESTTLAQVARCAGEQGRFWQMHDYLYDHQGVKEQKDLIGGAYALGLDLPQFANCMETDKYLPLVNQDLKAGQDLDLFGTPSFFLNGYRLPAGEVPRPVLEEYLQAVLQQ